MKSTLIFCFCIFLITIGAANMIPGDLNEIAEVESEQINAESMEGHIADNATVVEAEPTPTPIVFDEKDVQLVRDLRSKIKKDMGNVDAIYEFANCYFHGRGVRTDQAKAARWYERAAKKGHLQSIISLAGCYKNGLGVEQNFTVAAEWWTVAAKQYEHAPSMVNLGAAHLHGKGVSEDYAKAVDWWLKAAGLGSSRALYNLAVYEEDIEKNYEQALKFYQIATKKGSAEAQYKLGLFYLKGRGVEKNREEAISNFKAASENGDARASRALKKLGVL